MKYSEYFGLVLKSNGIPNLNQRQFSRMMNIVSLEGKLAGINRCSKFVNKDITMLQWKVLKEITTLTGNLKPEILLNEMVLLSKFD